MHLTEGSDTMLKAASGIASRTLEALGHRVVVHAARDAAEPVRFACSVCGGVWEIEQYKVNYYGAEMRVWSLEEDDDLEGRAPSAPIASCAVCKELRELVEAEASR